MRCRIKFVVKFIVAVAVLAAYASCDFNPCVRGEGAKTSCAESMYLYVLNATDTETDYQKLWKSYFTHMAIEERINPKLQRNMLRLRFRTHMTEFM